MKILLDTQCWLWWTAAPERLGRRAADLIAEARHPLYFSAASSWEIAIKVGLGKLELPEPPHRFVPRRLSEQGIDGLAVEHAHALRVAELPPFHSDPFDRLLLAQAQVERMTLLTADPEIASYDVDLEWAGQAAPPRRKPRRR
jgi:PIN domain nuclease of toxin-antitoxin system